MSTVDKKERKELNWLESILEKFESLISRSPESDVKAEVESELDDAEEFLRSAEKFEENIDNQSFLKQHAKGSREKAEEIIEEKIEQSLKHIVRAEKTAEQLEGDDKHLVKLERLTDRAEKLSKSIDSDLKVRER